MKIAPGLRQVNYAATVKINMPTSALAHTQQNQHCKHDKPTKTRLLRNKVLDNAFVWSIIIFTYAPVRGRVTDAGERSQTRSLAGTRNSKPTAPRSDRPTVCHRRLLRSQRSRSSQVRDAAPRAERGPLGDRCRDGFRLFATLVLSSSVSPRGGWACRIGSAQTWPQAGPQADRRGCGLYCRNAPEASARSHSGIGALDPRAFWDQGSPTKHRTKPAASSKKTPLNESGGHLGANPDLTEQYEQLRREATNRSEHRGEGLGLALFLRRGMAAWMQAWSQCTDVAPKAHLQPAMTAAVPIDLRMQVATLLAGIILGLHQEATP
jgi:hypothetical protein